MISIYKLKPKFQQLLMPILMKLHQLKITANQITIVAIILSLIIGILFWYASEYPILFLALPIGLLIRMALNALDGMMARKFNQMSCKGEVLNEIGDVLSDVFIFIPLLKFFPDQVLLITLFISLSIINEMAGLMGKIIGKERRYDGPMGKSDRALLLGIYGILAFYSVQLHQVALYLFIIMNILLIISTIIRLRKALQATNE